MPPARTEEAVDASASGTGTGSPGPSGMGDGTGTGTDARIRLLVVQALSVQPLAAVLEESGYELLRAADAIAAVCARRRPAIQPATTAARAASPRSLSEADAYAVLDRVGVGSQGEGPTLVGVSRNACVLPSGLSP